MKKLFLIICVLFSIQVKSQLPDEKKINLVDTINSKTWVVYFGSGLELGNIGYSFDISVTPNGVVTASWINGKFKGQLYSSGNCVGKWQHIVDFFEWNQMNFQFYPDGSGAQGSYTKVVCDSDRKEVYVTKLIRLKPEKRNRWNQE